jgi:hypothetical protein
MVKLCNGIQGFYHKFKDALTGHKRALIKETENGREFIFNIP